MRYQTQNLWDPEAIVAPPQFSQGLLLSLAERLEPGEHVVRCATEDQGLSDAEVIAGRLEDGHCCVGLGRCFGRRAFRAHVEPDLGEVDSSVRKGHAVSRSRSLDLEKNSPGPRERTGISEGLSHIEAELPMTKRIGGDQRAGTPQER
jgi:hypothetical protein